MCKVQMLRALVKQRLTAAAEEIFGLFERTIAEYEEELCRSKEESERQQKLLDAVFNPQLRLHRAGIKHLLEVKEEVPPEQQEWSSSLNQEDPELPHIKEEQEELWISQEGEQLQGLEEADITKFTFTPVPVKSEDDEEKPQSSQLHQRLTEQMKTEADREDCGGPEPANYSDPGTHPEPDIVDKTGDSFGPETDHTYGLKETREPQSGLNSLNNDQVPASDSRCSAGEKSFCCSECGKKIGFKRNLKRHMKCHTGGKHLFCSVCQKSFTHNGGLQKHMRSHTKEKPFGCSVCKKSFTCSGDLQKHLRIHTGAKETREPQSGLNSLNNDQVPGGDSICSTGEKPFSCSECGKSFGFSRNLKRHMISHTGQKPFSCSVCEKSFTRSGSLQIHMCSHTGEKPFSCSVCGKRFLRSTNLKTHMICHTGEKPFSCSICNKSFTQSGSLYKHLRLHAEKTFCCLICGKVFARQIYLRIHIKSHKGVNNVQLLSL